MIAHVPGNTKEAKASVLMARMPWLSYHNAIRVAAGMVASERRERKPTLRNFSPMAVNRRALNGWQPEPEETV